MGDWSFDADSADGRAAGATAPVRRLSSGCLASCSSTSACASARVALVELDTAVEPGQDLTLMGPSGSGKSTFLSFLCGTLDPAFSAEGRVLLDGEDITGLPPERRHLGILFQDALLFPHLSVAGNLLVALPPPAAGAPPVGRRSMPRWRKPASKGSATRDPATLSGGQQARVALMRTLLADPRRSCWTSRSRSSTRRCGNASGASCSPRSALPPAGDPGDP